MSLEYNTFKESTQDLTGIVDDIIKHASGHQFKGIDPYDLASSGLRLPKALLSKLSFLNKISLWNFRRMLGIASSENSKAYALFLHAMVNSGNPRYEVEITRSIDWLRVNRSKEFDGFSVGFAFEMSLSRYSSGPGKTSLVISLFVMFALIERYKSSKDDELLELLYSFDEIMEKQWLRYETDSSLWYSYQSDTSDEVYNATAKVGRFCAMMYELDGNPRYLERIGKILNYLHSKQHADGTWGYSDRITYVDGFHTAFILESIHAMIEATGLKVYEPMFDRGVDNYREFMFKDGRPYHFHPKHRPKDVRSLILRTEIRDAANAIILFSKIGDVKTAHEVLDWTLTNFYDTKERYFYFYDNALSKCKIRYLRWQAWMALAITEYQMATNEKI